MPENKGENTYKDQLDALNEVLDDLVEYREYVRTTGKVYWSRESVEIVLGRLNYVISLVHKRIDERLEKF